jgi:ribosome biogenesis GTPase A
MLFKHCHCHDVLLAYLFQGFNLLLFIKEKLADVHKKREHYRQQRLNAGMQVVLLVGYTSSGKTTLFNMLQKNRKPKVICLLHFAQLQGHLKSIIGIYYLYSRFCQHTPSLCDRGI